MSDIPSDIILAKRELRKIDRKMKKYENFLEYQSFHRRKRIDKLVLKYWGIKIGEDYAGIKVHSVSHIFKNICVLNEKTVDKGIKLIPNSRKEIPFQEFLEATI